MQKYANTVTDTLGNVVSLASVSVYTDAAHTALATVYSDNGITPTTNPRTTDSLGNFSFYAADGRYYIKVTKTGVTTQFLDDVILFDSTASNSAASINTVQSGTAPTYGFASRTVQTKNADWVSLKDFKCADGQAVTLDGSHDDTTGIQAAVDWAIVNSKSLFHPGGTAKLTAAITVGNISGLRIFGIGATASIFKQFTDNTQILQFTTCDTAEWELFGLGFYWNSNQTSANTSSIGIYLAGTSGTPANGFYNFHIHHCHFSNGYRAISANSGIQLAVWGFEISECTHAQLMTGAFFYYQPSPSIGTPNCCIRNTYIRADIASESVLNVLAWNASKLANVEINNGTIGGAGNPSTHVLFTSCTNLSVEACREEAVTINSTGAAVWTFSQCNAELRAVEFATITVNAGLVGHAITSNSSPNKVSVHGMSMSITLNAAATGFMFNGGFGIVENYRWVGTAGTGYVNSGSTFILDDLGAFRAPDGAIGAPAYSYGGETTSGWYRAGASDHRFAVGSTDMVRVAGPGGGSHLILANGVDVVFSGGGATSGDTFFLRDGAANTLAQKNGNADQLWRTYGMNGSYWERGSASELLTLSTSGATTDTTATLLPANSIIEAVVALVTTTITTATDWKLGDATISGRFAAANATMTAGATSVGTVHADQTGTSGPRQAAAAKVRVTTTGTPGAGVIRIVVFYRRFVAPTS